jgi:alpha-1,6-mannosyltransferase
VRARAAVASLLVCGLLVAVAAPHTESLLPESIRPVPAGLAGAFGGAGLNLHVGGAIAALVLLFVSYAVVVCLSGELRARAVVGAIVLLYAFVLAAPPLLSTDVFSYQAYARMGAHYGVSPYLHGPDAIRLDPIFPYLGAKWSSVPSAYGPLFTALSYPLAGLSLVWSVVAYKAIAAAAGLALVAVVWRCAQLRGADPVRAAALVGLNPLLVVYGVGGCHNDLLMLVVLAGALHALLSGRGGRGGVLLVLAVAVKLTAGLVLPFALAAGGRERRRALIAGALAASALLAALSLLVFGSGAWHLLATVSQSQSAGDWKSIPGAISTRLGLPGVGRAVGWLLVAAFAGICGRLLVAVWRGTMDWIDGAGWAMLAMLVASSSLEPWYVGWLLPLAALGRDPRLPRMALVMTGVVQGMQLLGYIPHG